MKKRKLSFADWNDLASPAEKKALCEEVGMTIKYYYLYVAGRRTASRARAEEMELATRKITPHRVMDRVKVVFPEHSDGVKRVLDWEAVSAKIDNWGLLTPGLKRMIKDEADD